MKIKEMRKEKGLTQSELAVKMGVRPSAVANWEAGTRCPNARRIPELAAALGCAVGDLYENE